MIKKSVMISVVLGGIVFGGAPARADQLQSFLKCAEITDDLRRLICFDAAAKNTDEIAAPPVKEATPSREQQVADFGKSQLRSSPVKEVKEKEKQREEKELGEIRLKVVKSAYTASKKFVVYLENGQIWKQKDNGHIRLPKGEFEVVIKKGVFGSFNMIVPTRKTLIKVKRVK